MSAARAQTGEKPKRRKAPEWITWESVYYELPWETQGWLECFELTYLDHTDSTLVLEWFSETRPRTDEEIALSAFNERVRQPLIDLGFDSMAICTRAEWSTHKYFLRGRMWRTARYATFMAQGNFCRVCGRRPPHIELHIDHIKPRSTHPLLALNLNNLQVMCRDCNLGKGNGDEKDWRAQSTDK